ncbi:leptomycin B resistance protein pmd1 [Microdochium trichocladiopsis]|uniref:Leptomycin B resistance protein pmd1 n=1 Tax=Microdochium trichocladiopsis TaxID=1682393 RepID=A0A9P9BWU4_9PEZI|nr:leptomycin B resistance protein pmd1 [Microdochium trichocladiopsis]KAH7040935.1 leptomycin B resistance protein pmd1 [Microdochium trichocladiopsis]
MAASNPVPLVANSAKDSKKRPFLSFFRLILLTHPGWFDITIIVVGTLAAIAAGVPFPLLVILFGQLVDNLNGATCIAETGNANPYEYEDVINQTVIKICYIAAAQFVLIYVYSVCWNIQAQRLTQRLRDRYFRALLRQEPSFFDDKHAGQVSARLNDDFAAIDSGTNEKVGRLLGQVSFFTTAYIVAFIKHAVLAGILISLLPAFLALTLAGSYFFKKYNAKSTAAFGVASSIASEALNNIPIVQSFGAGPRLEQKFAKQIALARKFGINKAIVAGGQAGLLYFIAYSSNALAYWQGSRIVADAINGNGDATVGQVYTVVFLMVDACIIMGGLAPLFPIFGAASAAYDRLCEDMQHVSAIDGVTEDGNKLSWETPGTVEFRNVGFAYPSRPDQPALKNVSLILEAGKHTAIVGQSGSGKSTVAALLDRLYNPSSGTILMDGSDITALNVRNVRGFLSLVQQEAALLDRSIFENIAIGLVNSPHPEHQDLRNIVGSPDLEQLVADAGKDIMEEAARRGGLIAKIAELVKHASELADLAFITGLDHGYSTQVGTAGKLVSGGQRQRIALARALIRDPKILVLDEASASLDQASEKRIQAAIDRVAIGRTVISIAHRLSTIKHADKIVVFHEGSVVEEGTYDALLEQGGAFARLVNLQGIDSGEFSESSSLANSEIGSLSRDIEKDSLAGPTTEEKGDVATLPEEETPEMKTASVSVGQELPKGIVSAGMHKLIRPNYKWLAVALPAVFIVGCTYTAMGLIFGYTVSSLSACVSTAAEVTQLGFFYGGLMFMLAVVEFFANVGSWTAFGRVSEDLVYRIRVLNFKKLVEQPVEWHNSEGRNPAVLLGYITKDGAALAAFSGSIIATILSVLVNFLVAIIVAHAYAWKIALVCLSMVPILLLAGALQLRATHSYMEKSHTAYVKAIGITVEAVNQIKTIASFSLEDQVVEDYRRALKSPRTDMIKQGLHTCIYLSISNSTGFFIYALSYWWGSQLIMKGEYTQTQFFVVQVSMLVSAQLWGYMFTLAPEFSRAQGAATRAMSLINMGNEGGVDDIKLPHIIQIGKDGEEKRESGKLRQDVEAMKTTAKDTISAGKSVGLNIAFRDVHFAYPSRPQHKILQGMSFNVSAGQFVGLVGPSGAGKSTVMGLMQRLYLPSSGSIEINGLNISTRRGDGNTAYRDDIAVVPQDSALFSGSIRFNVGLGARPGHDATDEEIEEACKTANIHDTIAALPQGYDTECGPNGMRLSGGQRQRLAIARALVRKPGLLLLDESTSALDAESEKALQVGLERIARGITVVAITHRLHTVQKADLIFMIEDGKVLDKGSHRDLMERSESYRVNALQQMLQ